MEREMNTQLVENSGEACKKLFPYVDVMARWIWTIGSGTKFVALQSDPRAERIVNWVYTAKGWKSRTPVAWLSHMKRSRSFWHDAVKADFKKIRKMAKGDAKMFRKLSGELIRTNKTDESLYYPYFPKPCGAKPNMYCVPRILLPGSTREHPKVFNCEPDPDCKNGVYATDLLKKGKPIGTPCFCRSAGVKNAWWNTQPILPTVGRHEKWNAPGDYSKATLEIAARQIADPSTAPTFALTNSLCLAPMKHDFSTRYVGKKTEELGAALGLNSRKAEQADSTAKARWAAGAAESFSVSEDGVTP